MIDGSTQGHIEGSPQNGYPKEVGPIFTFRAPAQFRSRVIHIGGPENMVLAVPGDGVVKIASAIELCGDQPIGGELGPFRLDECREIYGRPVYMDRAVAIAALRQLGFQEIARE